MSEWVALPKAGNKADRIAVNLDQATSMVQVERKTRILFSQADPVEVVEPVAEILGQAEVKRDDRP